MSRKSSWWLRPQRKGASNRAALNESKYFMEHNKVLRERIKELAAENAKLHELVRDVWHLFTEHGAVNPCDLPVVDAVRDRMRELGVEVSE